MEQTEYLKYVGNLATSTHAQLTVSEMLAKGRYEHHLRQACNQYRQAMDRMTAAISVYFPPGTRVTQPEGGFVILVELPGTVDATALSRRALMQGITIAPGPMFSVTQKYRNFIRLNCAVDWDEQVNQALVRLGQMVGEH